MNFNKSVFRSKTLLASLLTICIPIIFPSVKELIIENPLIISSVVGAVFGILRLITGKKLVLKKSNNIISGKML